MGHINGIEIHVLLTNSLIRTKRTIPNIYLSYKEIARPSHYYAVKSLDTIEFC